MSAVAVRLSTLRTNVKVTTAACALAAATVLTPAVAAQADVAVPMPTAPVMSDIMASPVALGPVGGIAEQGGWWFWGPGPGDDGPTTFFEFTPLVLVPNFLKPLYSWFTRKLNFSTCIFGITLSIGPYFTTKLGYSRGC